MKYHWGENIVDDFHTIWHCLRRSRVVQTENGHVTNKGKRIILTLSRDRSDRPLGLTVSHLKSRKTEAQNQLKLRGFKERIADTLTTGRVLRDG